MATFLLTPPLEIITRKSQEYAPIVRTHPGLPVLTSTTDKALEAFGSADGIHAYPSAHLLAVLVIPLKPPAHPRANHARLAYGYSLAVPNFLPKLEVSPEGTKWLVWRDPFHMTILRINRSFIRTLQVTHH